MSNVTLVTGGREFRDRRFIYDTLDEFRADISILIAGGATGVDTIVREWGAENGIHCAEVRALWTFYGNASGPIRNSAMLLLKPTLAFTFPGERGTADMTKKLLSAKIVTYRAVPGQPLELLEK